MSGAFSHFVGSSFCPPICLFSWLVTLCASKRFSGCQGRMVRVLTSFAPWELVATSTRLVFVVASVLIVMTGLDTSVTARDTSTQKCLQSSRSQSSFHASRSPWFCSGSSRTVTASWFRTFLSLLPAKNFSTSPLQVRHFHVSINSKKQLMLRWFLRTEYLRSKVLVAYLHLA